ncbi:M23 family metallopeptidase [Actinoplanes sp. NPDC023936]|uniref:M23 family metallopeptidase n=1 Tax=Actinoplanes sp. NPDC023936 TaxID=3154910 RepID=UPI0033C966D0
MRYLRTLSGLTLMAACLAGCGGAAGTGSPAATPHFVEPTSAAAPTAATAAANPPAASPATAASPAPESAAATSASPSAAPKAQQVKYVFPVDASNVDFHTTHSKYPATDLFVDCGERFVATTSGVVLEISLTDRYVKGSPDGPNNGGLSVSILGDDGVRYYGSHLSKVQSGIEAGARVEAGQLLGMTGKTGNANNVCHVHYGISPPCAETGDWKVRRGVIWPATFLTSWRKGGQKSPVATVEAWEKKNGCKA